MGWLGVQRRVRDSRAGYIQSMDVLRAAKGCGVYTKSSIMLGLGETDDEIIDTMLDLKASVCPASALLCPRARFPCRRTLYVKESRSWD